jgi:hypothetical protein
MVVNLDRTALIKLFSEFWKIDESKVNDDLRLDDDSLKSNTSIRFYQFIATVRSTFKVKVNNINQIFTFKDLIDNIVE